MGYKTDPIDAAFAAAASSDEGFYAERGLTKREYFAAQILSGLSSANLKVEVGDNGRMVDASPHELVDYAIILADHLIVRLNRER